MNLRRVFVSCVLVALLLLQHSESRRFGGFGGSRSSSGGSRFSWGGWFSSKPEPSVTHHSSPKVYKSSAPPAPTNFHQSEIHHSSKNRRFGGFGRGRSYGGGRLSGRDAWFSSKPKSSVTHYSSYTPPKDYKSSPPSAPKNLPDWEEIYDIVNKYTQSAPIAEPAHQNYKPSAPPAETNNAKPIGCVSQLDGHAHAANMQPVGSSTNNNDKSRSFEFVPGTSTRIASVSLLRIYQEDLPTSGESNSANPRPVRFVNPDSSAILCTNTNSKVNLNVHQTNGINTNSRPNGFFAPGASTSLETSHETNSPTPITQTNVKPSGPAPKRWLPSATIYKERLSKFPWI